jgi:hypothetical protein
MKTDEELKQVAQDLLDGRIFTDRHCKDLYELRSSFLVIALMEPEAMKKMEEDKINFIYEYYDKAAPRSVNGRPIFFSCHCLTEAESKRMFEFYEQMKPAETPK